MCHGLKNIIYMHLYQVHLLNRYYDMKYRAYVCENCRLSSHMLFLTII